MTRLVAVRPDGDDLEAVLVAAGRLLASARLPGGASDDRITSALDERRDGEPLPGMDDPWTWEEVDLLHGWLAEPDVRVVHAEPGYAERLVGGRLLHSTVHESRRVSRAVRRDRQRMRGAKVVRPR